MTFTGAKLALFLGEKLIVIERDDFSYIPFPGYMDLPGGGREGEETALDCALRECSEELGLKVPNAAVQWGAVLKTALAGSLLRNCLPKKLLIFDLATKGGDGC